MNELRMVGADFGLGYTFILWEDEEGQLLIDKHALKVLQEWGMLSELPSDDSADCMRGRALLFRIDSLGLPEVRGVHTESTWLNIVRMIRENTGAHPLDSGGAYGRHWEGTLPQLLDQGDSICVDIDNEHKLIDVRKDLARHLYFSLWDDELTDRLNRLFVQFTALCDRRVDEQKAEHTTHDIPETWEEIMAAFVDRLRAFGVQIEVTELEYTYNFDNDLNQDFAYWVFRIGSWVDDTVLIRTHNGCDARGGFSAPRFFCTELAALLDVTVRVNCGYIDDNGYRGMRPLSDLYDLESIFRQDDRNSIELDDEGITWLCLHPDEPIVAPFKFYVDDQHDPHQLDLIGGRPSDPEEDVKGRGPWRFPVYFD